MCSTSSAARRPDVQPVFDRLRERGTALWRRDVTIVPLDGQLIHFVAAHGRAGRRRGIAKRLSVPAPAELVCEPRAHRLGNGRRNPGRRATTRFEHQLSKSAAKLGIAPSLGVPMLQGRPSDWRHRAVRGSTQGPFTEQADRAAGDLRRPSRHRHREHAAVRGGAGEQTRADESRSNTRPRPAKCLSVISRSPTDAPASLRYHRRDARSAVRGRARRSSSLRWTAMLRVVADAQRSRSGSCQSSSRAHVPSAAGSVAHGAARSAERRD